MDLDMVNLNVTPFKSTDAIKKKIQSSATRVSDGSKDTNPDSDHGNSVSCTETMLKRWQDHLKLLPQADKDDMVNDNPLLNGGH